MTYMQFNTPEFYSRPTLSHWVASLHVCHFVSSQFVKSIIDVKTFFTFFLFWSCFFALFWKKTLAKFRAASRLTRSTFPYMYSNEIDLWFFCCMSNIENFTASLNDDSFCKTKLNGIFQVARWQHQTCTLYIHIHVTYMYMNEMYNM